MRCASPVNFISSSKNSSTECCHDRWLAIWDWFVTSVVWLGLNVVRSGVSIFHHAYLLMAFRLKVEIPSIPYAWKLYLIKEYVSRFAYGILMRIWKNTADFLWVYKQNENLDRWNRCLCMCVCVYFCYLFFILMVYFVAYMSGPTLLLKSFPSHFNNFFCDPFN